VVRCNWRSEVLVALVTRCDAPRAAILQVAAELVGTAAIHSVHWIRHDYPSGVILGGESEHVAGAPALIERVAGVEVPIGPGAFLQVNRAQGERMYHTIADWMGAGANLRAIDLFAGVGGIAFALAGRGARVLAVERDPAAVSSGTRAAQAVFGDAVHFSDSDAAALPELAAKFAAQALVVDPPRKGLGQELCNAISTLRIPVLVYASCNLSTLSRDLAWLTAGRYRVERVLGFDMMPGTVELETLVLMRT
jgi:tRNA/tmRNA/rRNA uracil-C5-methylase (TrmA/RlmC/RlmD family)